jgi:4-amino-4-deoxy-L-arabinose transferase-like glycosyltransferase
MHFSSALQSPLSYQPGPDEDYYLRFGEAVASGRGADGPEFTFMDPGYGYLLGAVFKLVGVNPVALYLLQALLDTATVYGILVIGRLLGRHRAGLYGALLYGLTATAIMFCTTLLKEVWVASYVTWWVVAALALLRSERRLGWALFGVLCGIGIALRSTLLLFGLAALLLAGHPRHCS